MLNPRLIIAPAGLFVLLAGYELPAAVWASADATVQAATISAEPSDLSRLLVAPATLRVLADLPEPVIADPDCTMAKQSVEQLHFSTTDSDDEGRVERVQWRSKRCSVELRIRGKVDFNDDMTAPVRLAPGASFRLEVEEFGGSERRLDATAGEQGRIAYTWTVDGQRKPFDAAARAWMETTLLEVVRTTGFRAEQRVRALLQRGGADAVMAEVAQLGGGHAQRRYLQEVLKQSRPDAALVERVVREAGRVVEPNHELASLLVTALEHVQPGRVRRGIIEQSSRIEADHEQRRVLTAAVARGPLDAGEREAYLTAARSLGADHEVRHALAPLLEDGVRTPAEVAAVLAMVEHISADHEAARVLSFITAKQLSTPALRTAYQKAVATISADHELSRVLSRLVTGPEVDNPALEMVLRSSLAIGADHELSRLLVDIASRYRLQGTIRQAYLQAAETIGSDTEYKRVASALLRQESI